MGGVIVQMTECRWGRLAEGDIYTSYVSKSQFAVIRRDRAHDHGCHNRTRLNRLYAIIADCVVQAREMNHFFTFINLSPYKKQERSGPELEMESK